MFCSSKSVKIYVSFFVIVMSMLPLLAMSQSTSKKHNNKQTTTNNILEIVESPDHKVQIMTDTGALFTLPKYNQIYNSEIPLRSAALSDKLATADIRPATKMLEEKLIEQTEIRELSARLGIQIDDTEFLNLYREVADWLGTRYKRGGMSRSSVDCSGFTNIIYKQVFGTQLDRVSTTIAKNVKKSITSRDDLIPGDMVFFSTFNKKYINHVGIYIGEGLFVHASIKRGVIVSSLAEGYYSKAFRKGGRMN